MPTHSKDIYVVTADASAATQQITESLQKKLPAQLITNIASHPKNKNAIYIAIGPSALRATLAQNNIDGVIFSAFTASQAYRAILENISVERRKLVTAIYADPSPQHQLRLISLLYKKPAQVAVILGNKNRYLEKILEDAARQTKIELAIEKLTEEESVNQALNNIASFPVLLALPDSSLFNQDNIRHILLTSYRRNQAVIGFSPSFVKAGALASTYSDIEDINAQLSELVTAFIENEQLPEPQFPKYFKTVVNDSVAHSLNMIVQNEVITFSHQPRGKQ